MTDDAGGAKPPLPSGPPSRGGGGGRRNDPLGPNSALGSRLRALYSGFEREPVPSDLIALLEQLDEAERGGGS